MQQDPYGDAESLFRVSCHSVVRLAYSLTGNKADAEDIVQESFCRLLVAWTRVPTLATAGEQRAYLNRIVINEAVRVLRGPYRKREFPGPSVGGQQITEEPLDEKVDGRDELQAVWAAISELPEMQRNVITLYAGGYEYEEIATLLGIKISTVRSHMSNARRQLSETVSRKRKGARG
jgi:RNA polymerase sigma-70 factor (ECF subfamily)